MFRGQCQNALFTGSAHFGCCTRQKGAGLMTRESEIAAEVTELLDSGTALLDPMAADRLQAARLLAVEMATAQVHAAPAETALAGAGHSLHAYWRHPGYAVTALLLLALVLLASLMIQQKHAAPVEADALLLASELPPEAYVDQGFDAWLKRSSPP
ncbi:MAG: DUF3619 family protein [Methylobacterium sp.]|nr:DUF3619 family protein [Methylobacterium sp.]